MTLWSHNSINSVDDDDECTASPPAPAAVVVVVVVVGVVVAGLECLCGLTARFTYTQQVCTGSVRKVTLHKDVNLLTELYSKYSTRLC